MNEMVNDVSSVKLDAVRSELNRARGSKKSLLSSMIVLLITVGVFMGMGVISNPVRDTMILITVLFIHETGHLLFMKIYKYKNVQMFFIPFFGAAVTGYETNPDASQKAVISLMGPLPGIVLSIICYIVFIITGNTLFYQYGIISLVINGFNLLPIYPLDGGHFFDYVLFSRNKYIEIFFKTAAVAALFYMAISLKDRFLMIFAFIITSTIPNNIQVARISHALKKMDLREFTFSFEIPDDFIKSVILNIKNYRSKNSGSIAYIASNAWNRFFMKPPKAITSILFIAGYLALIFIILVTLAVYTVDRANANGVRTDTQQVR